ncbi:hypothetical protein CDD80_3093 [Ophiocordyceps camponoti-rufipedis]|uniref:Uncharacterized protein n=1 Tax=Ophiocordyceps camponoti-rufipedis TaxID=2004952 RepID=A0A2C5Z3P4_9HYPO|nr:hypothetical protein CDD80_3093 [Ophiocordyceps camponoti-rufipedis]
MSDPQDTSPTRDEGVDEPDADVLQMEPQQDRPVTPEASLRPSAGPRLRSGSLLSSADVSLSLVEGLPRRAGSPVESLASGMGNTPVLPSAATRPGLGSPSPSFRPFDRRFHARYSPSPTSTPRGSSPAFVSGHSRNVSFMSNLPLDQADTDTPSAPWDVVRWTRLKKLNNSAFSELGRRNFGSPTCVAVSTSIVLGTSKGIILMFDYHQNIKMIIGQGTQAVESGPVTSIAVSADHSTIAGGHANGNIFTWDTSRAARPFLSIPHLHESRVQDRSADGHIPNVSVIHLGFLGTRHTALVSADDRGMAFSHLATRGTGALGRTVKTTRILGRYPGAPTPAGKPLKPSTVLAFAPLPLGNVERATDTMGLTAMLTPYLLVVVSTTPVARTQHKSARPKEVPAHAAMTGCLAWFPAVKLKVPDPASGSDVSKVKLVYCWSNVLTVLDVDETPSEDPDQPSSLKFKARSRWKCEEAIVAVQWLTRSVLTVLTISQRLIVLEDGTLRMTEAFDLLQKHIYHTDLFSKQLHNLVEQLDNEDDSMHGVVADAFYMSFKTYKGRIFLLGFSEVSIGALANWADRLIAMMEHGDYVGAIRLATSYYTGDADKLTIGLPEDAKLRHSMVQEKIVEIMAASLKYAFGQRLSNSDNADDDQLRRLAEACFAACQAIGTTDYLFDEVYERYEAAAVTGVFHETLEPYVLEEAITSVPPAVVKDLVAYHVSRGWEGRLEELICRMQTVTFDLDQITSLCKENSLYDALIYVWNQALGDYISPMMDLLSLLVPLTTNGQHGAEASEDYYGVNALKIFPYLSYILTSRAYPSGDLMDDGAASRAKSEIYWFFFSGKTIEWPRGSGRELLTRPPGEAEPAFPYLRMVLKFDAPSFLSALNEAFEDSFLNDSPDRRVNGGAGVDLPEEQVFSLAINRQYIVAILVDVMGPDKFAPEDTIYLDMFIARNLPKFPQYLLFSGSTLSRVLSNLCSYPGEDLAEDAQLSAEYLLSVYHPSDMSALMPLFREAGFYRILKRIYKMEKQYGKLVATYFEDPDDQDAVFDAISDCLRLPGGTPLNDRRRHEVLRVVEERALDLLELCPRRAAATLALQGAEFHARIVASAEDRPELQFAYLKALLEPDVGGGRVQQAVAPDRQLVEHHVRLMCRFEPLRVSDYVGAVQFADLRLEELLPTMEATGVVDAAVVLMARDGQAEKALERLVKHLFTLESVAQGLLSGVDELDDAPYESVEDVLRGLQRYVYVGIWLCQGQSKTSQQKKAIVVQKKQRDTGQDKLSADETLWVSLIDACVQVTKRLSPALQALGEEDGVKLVPLLRSLVQHTFTSLLKTTSGQAHEQQGSKLLTNAGANLSFLRIMRAFLTQAAASSPDVADLREVLSSIFAAYAYEESILKLSNRLLERSLFVNVKQAVDLRQRGWRPRGSTCEACGRRVWGPGVAGGAVLDAWEERQSLEEARRRDRKASRARIDGGEGVFEGRDKGKSPDRSAVADAHVTGLEEASGTVADGVVREASSGPLVVLACRHIFHLSCLEPLQEGRENGGSGRERGFKCPVDG